MFGHQDDQSAQQDSNVAAEPNQEQSDSGAATAVAPADQAPDQGMAAEAGTEEVIIKPEDDQAQAEPPAEPPQDDTVNPDPQADDSWQQADTPLDNSEEPISDVISPAGGFPKKPNFQYPASLTASKPDAPDSSESTDDKPVEPGDGVAAGDPQDEDELLDVKKQALEELSPLIDKLDLPAEEKFRIIMMMIQASDNEALVKAAYEAAHSIEDEKARAQALLDVVNEVNYFTQSQLSSPEAAG